MALIHEIRAAWQRRPFRPFVIRMADGTRCEVQGPEWLAIPPAQPARGIAFFTIPDGRRPDEYETHWLNLGLIAEVITPGIAEMPARAGRGDEESG